VRSLPFVLFAACSDYNVNGRPDEAEPTEEETGFIDGMDEDGDGLCDTPDTTPEKVGVDESCDVPLIGTFTPVIMWTNTAVGDAYATPVVGQLTDDNGSGDIDAGDTPDVVIANSAGQTLALNGADGSVIWSAGNVGFEPMTSAIGDLDGDGWPDVVSSGAYGTQAFRGRDGAPLWSIGAYNGGVSGQCGAVGIYDLNGDGVTEVVIGHDVYDGRTGATIVSVRGVGDGSGHGWAAPYGAAADIDQDGKLEVVVGNAVFMRDGSIKWRNDQSDGFVAVANFDSDKFGEIVVAHTGTLRLQDDDGTVLWSRRGLTGATIGPPTVADFDGDGLPEIGVAGNGAYIVVEHDGTTKWQRATNDYSSGFTGSAVFDFEGDGAAEVVYADENDVFVFDGATGAIKMQEGRHSSATCSESPAIADIDNDGHAEILYSSSAYSGSERGVTVITDADASWMPARTTWNQHAYAITNVDDLGNIPAKPATNWLTYNSFRSADLAAATGGALTDAIPVLHEICTVECDAGKLRVVVEVGNRGVEVLPGGTTWISAYARRGDTLEFLDAKLVSEDIAPGAASTGLVFKLDADKVGKASLEFRADDNQGVSAVSECNESNNAMVVDEGLCP
jgi:hypothetical protein